MKYLVTTMGIVAVAPMTTGTLDQGARSASTTQSVFRGLMAKLLYWLCK